MIKNQIKRWQTQMKKKLFQIKPFLSFFFISRFLADWKHTNKEDIASPSEVPHPTPSSIEPEYVTWGPILRALTGPMFTKGL